MHAISAREAGRMLPSLIDLVVDDRDAVEIVYDGATSRSCPRPRDGSSTLTTAPARDTKESEIWTTMWSRRRAR
ncbi:hypothetical protein SAMN04489793_3654 [Tsukamurella tyrosinosolvens]|uniref:Uncharacterized protein n=1 Tax=Tsukamurella tyrosinosolvens TaxID=57704 RepID=A0A1H4WRX5_TSUTY|nr:hypothetical protein SAMN04489793_3654 [Tsukamurella tyrosinosolvens]